MVCFEYLKTVCLKGGRKCYIICTDVIANRRFRYQDGFISLTLSPNVYWRIYDVMSCDRFSHYHSLKSPYSGNETVMTTAVKFVLSRLESSEVYSLFAIYLWRYIKIVAVVQIANCTILIIYITSRGNTRDKWGSICIFITNLNTLDVLSLTSIWFKKSSLKTMDKYHISHVDRPVKRPWNNF